MVFDEKGEMQRTGNLLEQSKEPSNSTHLKLDTSPGINPGTSLVESECTLRVQPYPSNTEWGPPVRPIGFH